MRVAILIDDFYPSSGGIGRSVETQIQELTDMGHEVSLIAPDRHLEKPRHCRIIECPTIYIEGLPAHLSILHSTERRADLISRCARFDIIHSQTERGALILGARLARVQGIPHVHTFHANVAGTHQTVRAAIFGTWLYQVLINPMLTRAAGRKSPRSRLVPPRDEPGGLAARMDWASFADIAGKVDAWSVPSPFMLNLVQQAAAHEVPGFVVPTGVGRAMLEAIGHARRERTDTRIRFLSIGRLAKEKRLDVLVRAFRRAAIPNSELVLVGDGDQRNLLKGLAAGADNIDFRGHLRSHEAIAFELVNADALALTSHRFDSQALVLSEAVAAGLPVLYCDDRLTVATSPDTAILTEPDVESVARGLVQLADRNRLQRMRAATAGLQERITPRHTAEQYTAIYDRLRGERRA
ncbi:glycosyltransferase [Arachnia propionica]|uniref:Glycosyltransferase n=1 Tax=Arachnia propionica TaxID=1750 RepID=A0A3P1WY08_9ACTN|nr:glycosyltransferase [Arachnia propionica]RRD51121.1 glycosyltransferase [Arachnia propionica]